LHESQSNIAQRIVEGRVLVSKSWPKTFDEAGDSVNSECGFN
jgi:hypothetical protein